MLFQFPVPLLILLANSSRAPEAVNSAFPGAPNCPAYDWPIVWEGWVVQRRKTASSDAEGEFANSIGGFFYRSTLACPSARRPAFPLRRAACCKKKDFSHKGPYITITIGEAITLTAI
jgi:hypothetical protein